MECTEQPNKLVHIGSADAAAAADDMADAGALQGVQQQVEEGSASASSVALSAVQQLQAAVSQHLPQPVLHDRCMAAAALLTGPAAAMGGQPSPAAMQLLRSICTVPLSRFNPEMMRVSLAAAWLVLLLHICADDLKCCCCPCILCYVLSYGSVLWTFALRIAHTVQQVLK